MPHVNQDQTIKNKKIKIRVPNDQIKLIMGQENSCHMWQIVLAFSCIFIDIFVKKKRDKIIDIYKINSYFLKW